MGKEDKQLKVGVLGCGTISQAAHFDACRKARNVELYAICDVADDLLQKMSVVHDVRNAYTDYDSMLADPQLDAVIIGIADQFHVSAALKAIAAGKHVLVEKPLGTTIEECEQLSDRVRASGLILQVGNMKRFDHGIEYAHQFIKEEMGQFLALKAWYCDNTYRYTLTDNVMPLIEQSAKAKKPEGDPKQNKQLYYMLTHGSHLVDTARLLGGNIISVHARHIEKYGAYSWFVMLEFENGGMGHLDLTIGVRMDWHEGFQVYGEFGSVIAKTYNPWLFKSSDVEVFSTKDKVFRRPLGEDGHFYKLQVEGFADTVLQQAPMRGASIEDGIAAMKAMVAIGRSVKEGKQIKLEDVIGRV